MEIIIKLNHDEPVKVKTSSSYGEMPQFPDMDKIRDKFWTNNYIGKLREKIDRLKMDLQNRDKEIQDLKLENDRLKKRDEIMLKFLKSAHCIGLSCFNCLFFDDKQPLGKKCIYNRNEIFVDISKAADDVLQELDNL